MKMYILTKDDVSSGFAMLAAAHASLATSLKFKDASEVAEWLSGPLKALALNPGSRTAKLTLDKLRT